MPQMAPLSWLSLFMFFIIMFLMFNIMNFFSFNYKPSSMKTNLNKFSIIWKW